ncbi:serine hydrolase domain-containing protein [Roseisolibacter agri]|nr:serine hydrolase domain-containing protein [Roseisolibacter agri]
MARLALRSLLTVPVAGAALAGPAAAQAPADRVDAAFARLAGPATPGCAVGVARGGQPVLQRAYGMADLEGDRPNTPETVFEAGSVTKQVTAAAVVLLALDGRFALEDDARRWLPELPRYERPITIRHLLTHTSGLRDWGSVAALTGWPRGTRAYATPDMLAIVARQRTLNYPVGDHYSYTNSGYSLLAVLVERASGMPFAEFTRTRLFAPLGMASTQWRDDYTRIVKGRAIAYEPAAPGPAASGAFRLDMPFESVVGNGGLLTTVGDLLRWTQNLETGAVGGPRFLAAMHRQARLTSGRQIEYASGLFVTSWRGIPEVSHSGSTGGYRAFLARYPQQRVTVAVLCNAAHANATALAHQVADAYLGDAPTDVATRAAATGATGGDTTGAVPPAGLYRDVRTGAALRVAGTRGPAGRWVAQQAPGGRTTWLRLAADGDTVRYEPMAPATPTARDLAAYAGRWRSEDAEATWQVRAAGDTLLLRDPRGRETPLVPAWRDAFTAAGTVWRFERDAAGRVVRLVASQDRVWAMPFTRS